MTLVLHLSDLHMKRQSLTQPLLFDRLVQTVRMEREANPQTPVAIVITGDVFDSASEPAVPLIESFISLHGKLVDALGGHAPTVVLPGNHDRRHSGLFGPHRRQLFETLKASVDPKAIYVAGCRTPFLAELVPPQFHGLPAHVVAYDSSYLPQGLIGAGGTIRLEDLLQVHAQLPRDDLPLLLLVHHHLVPTPITDVSHVDSVGAPKLTRWLVGTALPALVSNADREEMTMTALGAGTALTTLNAFSRAVLLLHGHKHVPTARVIRGMTEVCGDILIASAGSAGKRERVHATRHPDEARLWPTFNLVKLSDTRTEIESLSFSPKSTKRPPLRRELARAERHGQKWETEPVRFGASDPAPRVQTDEARYSLRPGANSHELWDFECQRRVELVEGAKLGRYVDFVHALPDVAGAFGRGGVTRARAIRRANRRIELDVNGVTYYRAQDALCRTLREAARRYGVGTAFEWIGLLCRYGAAHATLSLSQRHAEWLVPFGSVTDLTTGRERPLSVEERDGHWTISWNKCAPRSLLRLYWPLEP